MERKISLNRLATRVLMLLVLASGAPGCTVGPEFHAPPAPSTSAYTAAAIPPETPDAPTIGGKSQRFQWGQDLTGQWWTLFGSSELNRLILEAIRSYPDITAQQAALRASREDAGAQFGQLFPQIQGNALAEREKVSGATIGPGYPGFITNVYQATANVSTTILRRRRCRKDC
jgi:outer membrane protein TolC